MNSLITLHPFKSKLAYIDYDHQYQPIFFYPEGIYTKNLIRCFSLVDTFQRYYSKAILFLMVFRQPTYRTDNKFISLLFEQLVPKIKQRYKGTQVLYCWAREQTSDHSGLHYHVAIGLNGSLCKSGYYLQQEAQRLWQKVCQGCTCSLLPKNPCYVLLRAEPRHLRAFKLRISYAFKKRTKELIPKYTRKFGFSSEITKIKKQ